jgi:hypothetical protein
VSNSPVLALGALKGETGCARLMASIGIVIVVATANKSRRTFIKPPDFVVRDCFT